MKKKGITSPWGQLNWNPASLEYSYYGTKGWTTVRLVDAEQQGGIQKIIREDLAKCPDWSSNPTSRNLTEDEREMLDATYEASTTSKELREFYEKACDDFDKIHDDKAYDRAMKGL